MHSRNTSNYFILAGEASGDLHGSNLMKALKTADSHAMFHGIGGPLMRLQEMDCLLPTEEFEVMGFTEVLFSFPKLMQQFFKVRDTILRQQPQVVILIDYPGFNIRLAQSLRKKGYQGKIVQYISPTVWAWGKHRIEQMERSLDLLLSILPFEADYFSHTSLPVKYVGHPILESIQGHTYDENWKQKTGLERNENLIALFPGSRKKELEHHLPVILKTASQLQNNDPSIRFAISQAREEYLPLIQKMIDKSSLKINQDVFLVPSSFNYELMRDCRSAIAKSGTVTLELALHHKPSTVIYAVSRLNYLIAKYWLNLKLPYFCIVNILAGKEIFPELLAKRFTVSELHKQVPKLHFDNPERASSLQGCQTLKSILGNFKASEQAAQAILELIS